MQSHQIVCKREAHRDELHIEMRQPCTFSRCHFHMFMFVFNLRLLLLLLVSEVVLGLLPMGVASP